MTTETDEPSLRNCSDQECCEDNICATGWVSSHHLVPTKEEQLKQRLRQDAAEAFAEPSLCVR